METENSKSWEDEFEYMERNHGWLPEHKERIKSFIAKHITTARLEVLLEVERKLPKVTHDPGIEEVRDIIKGVKEQTK